MLPSPSKSRTFPTPLPATCLNCSSVCGSEQPWAFFLPLSLWVCILLLTVEVHYSTGVSGFDFRLGTVVLSCVARPRAFLLPQSMGEQAATMAPFGQLVGLYPPASIHQLSSSLPTARWEADHSLPLSVLPGPEHWPPAPKESLYILTPHPWALAFSLPTCHCLSGHTVCCVGFGKKSTFEKMARSNKSPKVIE